MMWQKDSPLRDMDTGTHGMVRQNGWTCRIVRPNGWTCMLRGLHYAHISDFICMLGAFAAALLGPVQNGCEDDDHHTWIREFSQICGFADRQADSPRRVPLAKKVFSHSSMNACPFAGNASVIVGREDQKQR